MTETRSNKLRIEANYAVVQGSYWSSVCVLIVFIAVYLSFKGLSDTQIGITSALMSIIAIALQIVISNFADANTHIPLNKIVTGLYIVSVACCAVLWLLPVPVAMMIIVYSLASASQQSVNGLLSALLMQFVNRGIPVNYGWPRGIGSISFAFSAYLMGIVVEKYSPDILMPVCIGLTIIAIISVAVMPNPNRLQGTYQPEETKSEVTDHTKSYWEMFRGNRTLSLFICAITLLFVGFSSAMVFLIRIMESLGGGARELGIGMFIHASVELPILFASGWIIKKFKIHDILIFSFVCFFIRGLGIYFAPSVGVMYGILAFNIFGMGLFVFASVFFVNNIVDKTEKVRAQSIIMVCQAIGGITGSSFAGAVIDAMGLKFLLMISWIILLGAALAMLICRYSYTRQFPAGT